MKALELWAGIVVLCIAVCGALNEIIYRAQQRLQRRRRPSFDYWRAINRENDRQ